MEDDSSSSSTDELVILRELTRVKRRYWVHPILQSRDREGEFFLLVQELKLYNGRFRTYFRMTVTQFESLLEMVAPRLQRQHTNYRAPIDPEERLVVCLRFLSTGDSFTTIAQSFRMGISTVGAIVKDTCQVIWEVLQERYMPEPTEETWRSTARRFEEKCGFPHCLGALDGKHVTIQAPPISGSKFYNYTGRFSVVLLALVDADFRFLAVDVGAYGSNSDGGTFANSNLGKGLKEGNMHIPPPSVLPAAPELGPLPYVMVADEAFPMKTYMLRPYPGRRLQDDLRVFNFRLSRARRLVENTFGILTQKWRLYNRRVQVAPETADHVVKATCILTNFVRSNVAETNEEAEDAAEEEEDAGVGRALRPIRALRGNRASAEAIRVRDAFKQYFNSPAGRVPWQDHVLRGGHH